MRTTIDLPDELHQVMAALAKDRGQTLSQTVADLLELALGEPNIDVGVNETTGLPIVRLGRPLTSADVRSLEDE